MGFFPVCFLPSTLVPSLPTMQLHCHQFSQRFRCVVAARSLKTSIQAEFIWARFISTQHSSYGISKHVCRSYFLHICRSLSKTFKTYLYLCGASRIRHNMQVSFVSWGFPTTYYSFTVLFTGWETDMKAKSFMSDTDKRCHEGGGKC